MDDSISRRAAVEAIVYELDMIDHVPQRIFDRFTKRIKGLPPVFQSRKGKWLWNKDHYALERHHLLERCPEDVNLIDVIEMICDCVCAGMARSGEVREVKINEDILVRAVANTIEMCKEAVVLEDF